MTKKKTVDERKETFAKWSQSEQGRAFRAWWKNHRYSGYSTNRVGRERFGILPYEAWHIWKYKAEFYFDNQQFLWPEELEKPTTMDIEKWNAECGGSPEIDEIITFVRQQWREAAIETDRLSKKLGTSFDAERNKKIYDTILEEYGTPEHGGFNGIRKEWEEDGTLKKTTSTWTVESMRAKIDEAYAYEPGQSEEETELLKRRRDD